MKLSKVFKLLIVPITTAVLLTACSGGSSAAPDVKVTKDNKSYLQKYDENLQSYIKDMGKILTNFNNALDGLYTKEVSREQFAATIKANIIESNKLVTKVESLDVDPSLFESHQNLIALINRAHQLQLTAIDQANDTENEIDKDALRNDYMQIKIDQATLANEWKVLRGQLAEQEKEKQNSETSQ